MTYAVVPLEGGCFFCGMNDGTCPTTTTWKEEASGTTAWNKANCLGTVGSNTTTVTTSAETFSGTALSVAGLL